LCSTEKKQTPESNRTFKHGIHASKKDVWYGKIKYNEIIPKCDHPFKIEPKCIRNSISMISIFKGKVQIDLTIITLLYFV
jgi:hypothetical protein